MSALQLIRNRIPLLLSKMSELKIFKSHLDLMGWRAGLTGYVLNLQSVKGETNFDSKIFDLFKLMPEGNDTKK